MKELARRKQLIVLEAELNRSLIAAEWIHLQTQCSSVLTGIGNLRTLMTSLSSHKVGRVTKWLPMALAAWRWFGRKKAAERV